MKTSIIIAALVIVTVAFAAPSASDKEIVAATLILEAGGERDPRAMAAVREVIANRAKRSGKSEAQIVLAPKQFSCWNSGTASGIARAKRHAKWREALELASNKSVTDYTRGADHYHTLAVAPSWAKRMPKTVTIQNHIFYRSNK